MEFIYKNVKDLINYDKNPRSHSKAQIDQICLSIKEFGFLDPIEIGIDNVIISGHARLAAAKKLKMTTVPVVINELDEAKRPAYIIAANKIAQNAGWDEAILQSELMHLEQSGFDMLKTGFNEDELKALLNQNIVIQGLTDDDSIESLQEKIITKLGDIWILGNHRLMCGNSTQINILDELMDGAKADMVFTDPPYNTGMTAESQKGSGGLWKGSGLTRLSHMFNDSFTDNEWQKFLSDFIITLSLIMKNDSVAYICLDWRRNHELIPFIESNGFKRSNLIVWDKMVHGLGSDYKYTHEFINVCKKGKPKLDTHQGDKEYSDVWHIQRKVGKNEDHATAKPVELMDRSIRHASRPNDIVADLFGGSGSTLIACKKTNRKCYMMEISEQYCDVIIRRWQKFTGKDAILESTGESFNDLQ